MRIACLPTLLMWVCGGRRVGGGRGWGEWIRIFREKSSSGECNVGKFQIAVLRGSLYVMYLRRYFLLVGAYDLRGLKFFVAKTMFSSVRGNSFKEKYKRMRYFVVRVNFALDFLLIIHIMRSHFRAKASFFTFHFLLNKFHN